MGIEEHRTPTTGHNSESGYGQIRFDYAPVSERIRALTPEDLLQIKYSKGRDAAYSPDGWMSLETAREKQPYAAELDPSDRYKFWMAKDEGEQRVYKLADIDKYDLPNAEQQLTDLLNELKNLPPELRQRMLPAGFMLPGNLSGQ